MSTTITPQKVTRHPQHPCSTSKCPMQHTKRHCNTCSTSPAGVTPQVEIPIAKDNITLAFVYSSWNFNLLCLVKYGVRPCVYVHTTAEPTDTHTYSYRWLHRSGGLLIWQLYISGCSEVAYPTTQQNTHTLHIDNLIIYIHTYAHTYAYPYPYIHTRIHIYIIIYIIIYKYIYIHIYTYSYTVFNMVDI